MPAWNARLAAGADLNLAKPHDVDVDGMGILDGLAVQVVAAGRVVLALVERVEEF